MGEKVEEGKGRWARGTDLYPSRQPECDEGGEAASFTGRLNCFAGNRGPSTSSTLRPFLTTNALSHHTCIVRRNSA